MQMTEDPRTLERTEIRDEHWIEAAYQALWRWLREGSASAANELFDRLDSSLTTRMIVDLSPSEALMLSNVLRWILLFVPEVRGAIQPVVDQLKIEHESFELACVRWLWSLRMKNQDEAQANLEVVIRHPLSNERSTLTELVDYVRGGALPPAPLTEMSREIKEMVSPGSWQASSVIVDLTSSRIVISESGPTIRSKPLCELLFALKCRQSLPFHDVAWIAFGHAHFDFNYHGPRIYNLISRLKHILPAQFRLKSKDARLYFEGDWNAISFREYSVREFQMRNLKWKRVFSTPKLMRTYEMDRNVRPALIFRALKEHGPLTRTQLETITGKSRSTVHRAIKMLVETGQIRKQGSGVSTRYSVKKLDTDQR